ncbi:uncharacterized protein LOC113003382 isoform X2 [Solenopsis invicta]|uniref:uncharacterized protein LOC113003382 isoform X2 n=1 Tax=Solenopsis invicta TaxID=13686 RepID=UPI00193D68A0|nr:uncharacterized protein LOC113003382 isoform X2 [Solenopsis invicta]
MGRQMTLSLVDQLIVRQVHPLVSPTRARVRMCTCFALETKESGMDLALWPFTTSSTSAKKEYQYPKYLVANDEPDIRVIDSTTCTRN